MPGSDHSFEPETPNIEGMLETLFWRAGNNWDTGAEVDVPPNLLVLYGNADIAGAECIQILNLETRDRIEITRPTLDSPNYEELTTSPNGETGVLYRIIAEDLFLRVCDIEMGEDETEVHMYEMEFDVFAGRIALCGELATDNEDEDDSEEPDEIYDCAEVGSSAYARYAARIIELTDLHNQTKDFELTTENLLG